MDHHFKGHFDSGTAVIGEEYTAQAFGREFTKPFSEANGWFMSGSCEQHMI